MKKEKELKYYCDTCRTITEHYGVTILEEKTILCQNWKYHYEMEWCRTCGKRIDNGECQKQFKHNPIPCKKK